MVDDAAPPRPRRRRARLVLLGLLALVLVWGGWVAWRGQQAASALGDAADAISEVRGQVRDGSQDGLAASLDRVASRSADAVDATRDPVWRLTSGLPLLGPNLAAVTTVADALDVLAADVLGPLTDLAALVESDGLRPSGGTLDLAPLAAAAPTLEGAAVAARAAHGLVAGIDRSRLVDALAHRVGAADVELAEAASLLEGAARAARVLPPMLGHEGERRYLMLFVNSAEVRSAGGIVGGLAVLETKDGALALTDYRAGVDMPRYGDPVLPLDDGELAVHGPRLGTVIQNVTMTPDFPRTAALAVEMWRRATGEEVDGVVATDAVALSRLLRATGPVTTPDGVALTADDVVTTLLSTAYEDVEDPALTDAFFAGAAGAVFEAVAGGKGSTSGVAAALADAAGEGRVRVWSAHEADRAELAAAGLDGAFLSGERDALATGVFLDSGSRAKLQYHLETAVEVAQAACTAQGARVTTRLTLTSTVPTDAAAIAALPDYVTGPGVDGVAGAQRILVTAYSPVGGSLGEIRMDRRVVGGRSAQEAGRDAEVISVVLAPGERRTVLVQALLPAGATRDDAPLLVRTTPTLTSSGRHQVPSACG